MRLLEIFKVKVDKDAEIQATDGYVMHILRTGKLIAKAGNVSMYLTLFPGNIKGQLATLYILDAEDTQIGVIDLQRLGRPESNVYRVMQVVIDSKYQGFDMAVWAYLKFIQAGNTMVSGGMQSLGGLSIWKKLAESSDIIVYVYDKFTDTYEDLMDGEEVEDEAVEKELNAMGFLDGTYEFPGLPDKLMIAMKR